MKFSYKAHLLAEFRFVGVERSPVLYQFCVRSEERPTTDFGRGFYAIVTDAQSDVSYAAAVMQLRKHVQTLMPSVARLVRW